MTSTVEDAMLANRPLDAKDVKMAEVGCWLTRVTKLYGSHDIS